jgi:hypothetical protein
LCIAVSICWAVGFEPKLVVAAELPCCHGGVQPTIKRVLARVRIKQTIARRIEIWNEVMKGASPNLVKRKVLLKQINATYRPFGV